MPQTPHNRRRAILLAGLSTVAITGTALYLSQRETSLPAPAASQARTAPAKIQQSSTPGEITAAPSQAGLEQESLWATFENARRGINALTPTEAALPINEGVSHFSYLPSQDLTARYGKEGVTFARGRNASVKVGFEYDDGGAPSELTASGTRAEFHHGDGVVEWFENGSAGIEHGFTLSQRPASATESGVNLDVSLSGLEARGTANPDVLELGPEDGAAQLRYSTLKAWDADGTPLLARMEPTENGIRLSVDDRSARYPVTIDPLITTIEDELLPLITGAGDIGEAFGSSIAIDGNTAIIGARSDTTAAGTGTGSAYVFNHDGTSWTLGTILSPDVAATDDSFGAAVDLSGDTAIIGSPGAGSADQGAIYVFVRSGGTWTQQARVVPADSVPRQRIGAVLALSGDTLISRAEETGSSSPQSCYFFARNGSTWTQQFRAQGQAGVYYDAGGTIALDGDTAMMSASVVGQVRRCILVYKRTGNTWAFSSEINSPSANNRPLNSIVLNGDRAVVGVPDETVNGINSGAAFAYSYNSGTGTWGSPATLLPSQPSSGAAFASLVKMDGNTLVASLTSANTGSPSSGAAVVFTFQNNTWTEASRLTPSAPVANLRFGAPFDLDGQHVIVGLGGATPPEGVATGYAEPFTLASGIPTRHPVLEPGDASANELFGTAVAIEDDTAVIGASGDYTSAGQRGSVYVFARESGTWAPQAKLNVEEPSGNIRFGSSVALSGNTLLAGAARGSAHSFGGNGGQAWAYVRNGTQWTMQEQLVPDTSEPEDGYATSMAIDGDRAVIGAPDRGSDHGSVFVFERSGGLWYQQAVLEESPRRALANFGSSVDLDGSTILIGAPQAGQHPGCAYVYTGGGTTWTQQARLDGAGDLRFGSSVSLSGSLAIAGAPESNAAHIFAGSGSTWNRVARLTTDDVTLTKFGQSVALDGSIALVGANEINPAQQSTGEAFLFARENAAWSLQDRINGGASVSGARALDLSGDVAIIGSSDEDTVNPFSGLTATDTGTARIYRITGELLNSPESQLLAAFDADANGSLSAAEWKSIYATPPAKEKLFALADSDASGAVSLAELTAAGSLSTTSRVVGGWLTRADVFIEVDADKDGQITRTEIAAMYAPGTSAKTIDAFWSRAKGGSGLDLVEWVKAKTLPSFPSYEAAKATRAKRLAAANALDTDDNGQISRAEFAGLFAPTATAKVIDAAWKAATSTPKNGTAPASITIAQFVEAPKLPVLPSL